MIKKMTVLFILLSAHAFAQSVDKQAVVSDNLITVGAGFENGKHGWTASSGTFTTTTTAANVGVGVRSGSWDASAASQTLTTTQYTVKAGLFGRNCLGRVIYQGGDANLKLQVIDGSSNVLNEQVLAVQTAFKQETVTFQCPSSGTVALRIASTADAAIVYLDSAFIGENYLVGTASQAQFVGSCTWPKTSACSWSRTAGTLGSFSADSDCVFPSGSNLKGAAQAPATKIPACTFPNIGPGHYKIEATGDFDIPSNANAPRVWAFSDGTNNGGTQSSYLSGTGQELIVSTMLGGFNYTTAQGTVTFEAQCFAPGGSDSCAIDTSSRTDLNIRLYKYPSASEQVFKPGVDDWRVDAAISGANINLGTTAQTTYGEMSNGSLTLVNNAVDGAIPAQIACTSTEESSGTTCTGNENNGLSFVLPKAGTVKACATYTHYSALNNGNVFLVSRLVETSNASQTVLQDGLESVSSGNSANITDDEVLSPVKVCSKFKFSSTGKKTLRAFYVQSASGTIATNVILADAGSGSSGGRNVHWTVEPDTQQVPAPILVGNVITSAANTERIERVYVAPDCSADPCTMVSHTPGISSVTRTTTGTYVLNFPVGTFSQAPSCVIQQGNSVYIVLYTGGGRTTTSYSFTVRNPSSTLADAGFDALCMGPR